MCTKSKIKNNGQKFSLGYGITIDFFGGDTNNDIALLLIELLSVITEITQKPIASSPIIVLKINPCRISDVSLFDGNM